MKKRLNVLTRIGNLQSQLHDLGRWRLSAIERQQAGLSEDLRAIFETLESGDIAYGAQSNLGARHIRTLQRRLDTLARESESVRCKAQAHGMRAKLAEQAIETIAARYRDLKERKELAELVEQAIARRSASST
jgi:outer membrane murein-binding lipoprotein Lpp